MTDQGDSRVAAVSALLDRDSIRGALLRYCRGVDRADRELIASVFHPGAVVEHGDFTLDGSEVAGVLIKATAGHDPSVHQVTNHTIELAGDVAFSESYFTAYVVLAEGGQEVLTTRVGRYIDRFLGGTVNGGSSTGVSSWNSIGAIGGLSGRSGAVLPVCTSPGSARERTSAMRGDQVPCEIGEGA